MGASVNELFGEAAGHRQEKATTGSYGLAPPNYRLPAASRIGNVTLQVSDLRRARDFYERILGFHVIAADASRAVLGVEHGTAALITLVEHRTPASYRSRKRLGLFHIAILLPSRRELGRFLRHLEAHGVRAGAGDHRVSEALYLHDPDDLGIEVYADRPLEQWRRVGRELVMATDSVDVGALLAAAGSDPWLGMPAGTTIGHVHLHVGDLDEASTFYGDALGFDRMVWSYPDALFMAAGGYHHHLGTNTWAGAGAEPAQRDDPQLLEWTLLVPRPEDVGNVLTSLRQNDIAVVDDHGSALVRDPWGTLLRVRSAG